MPKKKETRGGWNRGISKYKTEEDKKLAREKQKVQWKNTHLKHYQFQVNTETDKDIIDYLSSTDNIAGTVKEAIRLLMKINNDPTNSNR